MEREPSSSRTILLIKNIIASFIVKGWVAVVVLLMVPLTLKCLGNYQNGVWLTISSMLVWIDQMDIGLGNGLRNKLAVLMAHGKKEQARSLVSSTMAMLAVIMFPILIALCILIWFGNVYSLLNVIPSVIPELRVALLTAVVLVCMTFVLKFIGNVYMGMQLPSVSNLLVALGQTLAMILTWGLYRSENATFILVVAVNTAAPLVVYLLAYPYTFYKKFPFLKPAIKCINIKSAVSLGNLGIKFFWLQIASLLQFMTSNMLISHFFSPEMVTPYQISYRYMSIMMAVFSVVCMPFWSATTDAYAQGDMNWIRKANSKLNLFILLIALALIVMTIASPFVYSIWIGNNCQVPFGMTIMMAIYVFQLILSMRYSYFLNGVGALRLQLYLTISAIVFIPAAWVASTLTHDIMWFLAVMLLCNMPSLICNGIQFKKILSGTATGIWEIQ